MEEELKEAVSGILTRPWGLTSTGSNGMFHFYEKLGIGIKAKQLHKTLPIFMYSKKDESFKLANLNDSVI